MKVIFLHPDLGIGGAERLVVDTALALKRRGHSVVMYTNRHEPSHCFVETKDGTLPVHVVGSWIPRSIFGRFRALCAYLRFVYAALYLAFFAIPAENADTVFCDLISACVPFLKLSTGPVRVIYYCHHPDKLLSAPGGFLKRLYRMPLNAFEEWTTAKADTLLVNSEYTREVFERSFPSVSVAPEVCYPSIDVRAFSRTPQAPPPESADVSQRTILILSINRYERKKNLGLALRAIHALLPQLEESTRDRVRLVMAGGYDPDNLENLEHYEELLALAENLDLSDTVRFLRSPSDVDKVSLLRRCDALVYTPSDEHFGIVPLEAMYFGKPVVAVNSGGPTETVVRNVTGFLCAPDESDFAAALKKLILDPNSGRKMGEAGRQRFNVRFSYDAFEEQIDSLFRNRSSSLSSSKETKQKKTA